MKNRLGSNLLAVIFIAILIFLAVDVGYYLYNPDRLASALPACTLDIISGRIEVQTRDSLTWEEAYDGMILEPGSRVRTAADAHASLIFSRGTTTKLEPGTDLILAKLEGTQDAKPNTVVLQQRSGETWNQVAKGPADAYDFQIKTPSAEVKVHGTSFSTEVDESGKTRIQTSEGQVSVSAQGKEVQVSSGQQTEVEPGAVPSAPTPIPPARNELIVTISKPALGLVVDPSGSRTGYLPDGSPLNQISGSRLSSPEESCQTIRIPEPDTGEYDVVLRGVADGLSFVRVEGFTEGKSTFIHAENITAANEMVLKLHCDILDGLLQGAAILNLEAEDSQPIVMATTAKTAVKETEPVKSSPGSLEPDKKTPDALKAEKESDQKSALFSQGYKFDRWVGITSVVVLLAVVLVVVWRKH